MDKLQKMSDDPLVVCPACDEETLRKKISAAGFRLKGSGWYETDFKTGKKKQLAESDSKKTPTSDGSKAKSSDSAKSTTAKTSK